MASAKNAAAPTRPKRARTLLAALAVTACATAIGAGSTDAAAAVPRTSTTVSGSSTAGDRVLGDLARQKLGDKIAKIAKSKTGSRCFTDQMCSADWCAYFARWVWQKAGVPHADVLDGYAYSAVTKYAARYHTLSQTPHVGDLVVWQNSTYGRHHVNIVVWVSADKRLIRTVGGNEGSMDHRASRVVESPAFDWRKGRNGGVDHVYKGFVRPVGA
ncbi:CHAP domain-containing protein [Streptomyces sp. NPDC052396]|uniref:CHAP domain-containing protein n=1 Tax=Streptomyces sp. NPDC052396 TaxID=3365689 RepID=UPI0037CF604F